MNKKLTLMLALLVLAVISVSIVTAVNDASDSLEIDEGSDDAVSQDIDIDKISDEVKEKASKDSKDDKLSADDDAPIDSFIIKKVWKDNGDKAGKRPDSVTVHVSINGNPRDPIVLNESNGWKTEVTDLDEDASVEVTEDSVDGYTTNITGNVKDGYKVTNTLEEDDNQTAADVDDTSGDDTSDDSQPEKTTTTTTTTKVVKKQPEKVKDKHKTGNPILLGVLAISVAGLAYQLRRKE